MTALRENDDGIFWSAPAIVRLADTEFVRMVDDIADRIENFMSAAVEDALKEFSSLLQERLGLEASPLHELRQELAVRTDWSLLDVCSREEAMRPNMLPG
jgi:hypothetical protein